MSSVHGTRSRYAAGCRCDLCRKANADWQFSACLRRAENLAYADVKHGSKDTYNNWMCRCTPCTTANAEHSRKTREREAAS
jgi:hypothetical protein